MNIISCRHKSLPSNSSTNIFGCHGVALICLSNLWTGSIVSPLHSFWSMLYLCDLVLARFFGFQKSLKIAQLWIFVSICVCICNLVSYKFLVCHQHFWLMKILDLQENSFFLARLEALKLAWTLDKASQSSFRMNKY